MRLLALLVALLLPTLGHADKPGIDITWLGHATFLVTSPSGQTTLLIDPFIRQNPSTPAARKKIEDYKPTAILVTHSHFDHAADAVDIAKASGAKVIGVAMYVSKLELPDAQKLGGNVGGEIAVGDVKVHFVPAMHGSEPSGRPLGFVIEFADGRRLYHTGDTWIFGDMALIQEIHHPNIILLQAGGGPYNQNPTVARLAIEKYFKPDVVIPMHFGTWPVLADEATVKKAFEGFSKAHFMTPGTTERF
ncbi:MAG: metal-dependent hydrolase [Myxococcales bacterium]|nr:metal-dependent hydrolase [Myxococcales bacterium]